MLHFNTWKPRASARIDKRTPLVGSAQALTLATKGGRSGVQELVLTFLWNPVVIGL